MMPYKCPVCPNNCIITEEHPGRCGTRYFKDGNLELPFYGVLSALSSDPVEKKPLYHYHPGRNILSAGFYGCSLSCPFCQNYTIAKEFGSYKNEYTSPELLVKKAVINESFGIAYTYSEPLIHLEYLLSASQHARAAGIKNVLITNGYINPEPADELLPFIDAANIDLKSFNPDFYKKELKGKLEPVLNFIQKAAETTHIEVTTLVIPGKNDSEQEIRKISKFLSEMNRKIPFHLSAYYPVYKYKIRPTSAPELIHLAEIASEYLDFVYTGNISSGLTDTICPNCGNTLIHRSGYRTASSGINKGSCTKCGSDIGTFGIIL